MRKEELEQRRAKWLGIQGLKGVVQGAFSVESEMGRLCPSLGGNSNKVHNDALRQIANTTKSMVACMRRMENLEADGGFGFKVGLGFDPYTDPTLFVCVCLLLAARLEPSVGRHVSTVSDLTLYAGRRDGETCLRVRAFVRDDGILKNVVFLGGRFATCLDDMSVRLRERFYNATVGLPGNDKSEQMVEAECLVGRGR